MQNAQTLNNLRTVSSWVDNLLVQRKVRYIPHEKSIITTRKQEKKSLKIIKNPSEKLYFLYIIFETFISKISSKI